MNDQWGHAIIDSLVAQGVRFFVLCPGNRSTPLAIAVANHPDVEVSVHFDERGGAFAALGYGLATERAAAIIVTSGTAVGNLMPAVMEAHHAQVPMVLLTSDRPQELRDCGANQATDQIKLFGSFVEYAVDLSTPSEEASEGFIGTTITQAMVKAQFPKPGPVQINCPFREPFFAKEPATKKSAITPKFSLPRLVLEEREVQVWAKRFSGIERGVIIAGKTAEAAPLKELSEALGWPLFADITSKARGGSIPHFDGLIKAQKGGAAEAILHVGGAVVSKALLQWVGRQGCPLFHLSATTDRVDPMHRCSARLIADPALFCKGLLSHLQKKESGWLSEWREMGARVEEHIGELSEFGEMEAILAACKLHGKDSALFLGNSMPVRDADSLYFPKEAVGPIFANRGLSGIDGNVATCAGIARTRPVIAVMGDQTLLHDLNSLALLKNSPHPIHLVVINNGGGGIFSFIDIAQKKELLDPYFANAHAWSFENAANQFGVPYLKAEDVDALKLQGRSCLIEVVTSREENLTRHKALQEEIQCLLSSSMVS